MRRRLGPTVAFRLGIRDREAARRSVRRILEWDFDRILPGHGEIVEAGTSSGGISPGCFADAGAVG